MSSGMALGFLPKENIMASEEPRKWPHRILHWPEHEPDFLILLYSEGKCGKIRQTTGLKEISLAHQSNLHLQITPKSTESSRE